MMSGVPLARGHRDVEGQGHNEDQAVELTGRRARTHIGIIQDPGHAEPWIIAMYRCALPEGREKPGYLRTLEYADRWGIEPMFSDFKSRGFGIEDTQCLFADGACQPVLSGMLL